MFNRRTFLGFLASIPLAKYTNVSIADEINSDTFKESLFELNDSLTRSRIVNSLNEHYKKIQSLRGIYDFVVVCDERNNTYDVIDNNDLVVDIYIKLTSSTGFEIKRITLRNLEHNTEKYICDI